MRGTGRIACLLALSLVVSVCSGCGAHTETTTGEGHHTVATGMESTPIIEYTVPKQTANVLVDRLGYSAVGEKEVAIKGKNLPKTFRLVNAETGDMVYEGEIEKVTYHNEPDLYLGYAVFEGYEEPGEYYVECDMVGRSYTFAIVEDLYKEMFREMSEKVMSRCADQTVSISEVASLLTAYEWYPDLFVDSDGDEVPDVLELLLQWFETVERNGDIEKDAVMNAALLAKFSYVYQKYDKKYATTCLQKASAMFDKNKDTMQKGAENFFALAELYRASGLVTYRNQIADYKSYFEKNTSFGREQEYLYGAMTYMVTRQKVDVDLCNVLLDTMMDRGEEISGQCEEITHPISAKNNGPEDILASASEIIFLNYVLNSYQYCVNLQELLHYLGGRNMQSVSFYPEEEDCAGYILLLAQLASMPDIDTNNE